MLTWPSMLTTPTRICLLTTVTGLLSHAPPAAEVSLNSSASRRRPLHCQAEPSERPISAALLAPAFLEDVIPANGDSCCPQPEKVTAEQLEVELGDRQKPLIIDFYATWCGPCLLLAKELEQARSISNLHPKIPPQTLNLPLPSSLRHAAFD